jgi:hypothetical protein
MSPPSEGLLDALSSLLNYQEATLEQVLRELRHASSVFPPFNSAHEGFAVLKEEVDELWDEVKKNQKIRSIEKMRKEAIQVAAMALRFLNDIDG